MNDGMYMEREREARITKGRGAFLSSRSRIIRYPYGLVARGVLKYRPLPFTGAYSQSVAICDVARVEPISGVISEDPDQSYCLKHAKGIDQ